LLFSYGSGCVAALYSIVLNFTPKNENIYGAIRESAQRAFARLDARIKYSPEEFTEILHIRERIIKEGGKFKFIIHILV
jgi:3-hydroxy-3-methylglutaryl CoA synthase